MEEVEKISKDKLKCKVKALLDVVVYEKNLTIEDGIHHKVYRTVKQIVDCDVKVTRKCIRIDEHNREIVIIVVYKYTIRYLDSCGVERKIVKSEVVEEKIHLGKYCEKEGEPNDIDEKNVCLEIKKAYCKDVKFHNCGKHSIITGKVVIKAEAIIFEKKIIDVLTAKCKDEHDSGRQE
ncbi:MAG: hypothetical protein A2Y24_01755 [Clostridiales bacterium GWE2_32_10]|nr:MAG: hypothetical protein A2Y24_01755 [Clostridiales bacterium GWE2_32_10]HBY19667.1 hypothetical protein [Clostridiales bacterium]